MQITKVLLFLGPQKFRIDPIKKDRDSKQHLACVHAEHMSCQPSVDAETTANRSGFLRLHEGNNNDTDVCFEQLSCCQKIQTLCLL